MEDVLPFLIPIVFLIVFPLFWVAILFLISRLSGWASLAGRFPVPEDRRPAGDAFGWSSAQFNLLGRYSNCLDVVIARQGIYMRPVWLFRFGHAPLLIPWNEVTSVQVSNPAFFTVTRVTVRSQTHGGWPTAIRFHGRLIGESLERNHRKWGTN